MRELIDRAAPVRVDRTPGAPPERKQLLGPATRVFQALRILTNRELANLQQLLRVIPTVLKPGGVAVHTTEFNLSSNDDTLEAGGTVIYRRRDVEALVDRLRARGHHVEPLDLDPGTGLLDRHVDVPPYLDEPHLRLRLERYTCTSVGLIVTRGAAR